MATGNLEQHLRKHVLALSADIGERNVFKPLALAAAAGYIREAWQELGYTVTAQPYTVNGVVCENLEITLAGSRKPSQIILVGAHYDSVLGSPGANDNGSGVAALLEISRCLADATPGLTIRLVAFVNEESPFFYWSQMGSLVYAKAAKKRGDAIRLMISLEMLGCFRQTPGSQAYPPLLKYLYPDRSNFIAFVSNLKSAGVLRQAVNAFKAHSDFPIQSLAAPYFIPGVGWSDQLSFWRQGYRAIMITDTAFYRYRYYHTAEDTADKVDFASMARVVEGVQGALLELAA